MANTDELIELLAKDAAPIKPISHPYLIAYKWMMGAMAYIALTSIYTGLRPNLLEKLRSPLFLAEIGLLTGIILTTLLSAALLAFPDIYQKRKLAFAPVYVLILFVIELFFSLHFEAQPAAVCVHSVECLIAIGTIAVLPAAWMFYILRKFSSTHYYLVGSISLLSAFNIGALSHRLSEQTDSIVHLIQWHYLPMVGVVLLGSLLGKIMLRW